MTFIWIMLHCLAVCIAYPIATDPDEPALWRIVAITAVLANSVLALAYATGHIR